ncbi:hypothetical protein CORC01_00953 [Colletotrichum orchidophilum]|uniref:Uncharacterized protein n=1 Tax=Colletotrichum orchidophilum TaxID=1209926 RepID=A0A1G4BQB8_9PEZI|nr:uncharacterized protein CORC01_00953 [Colletotrichum orchidophilum]OHF03634.1 hypothetical protein CORC01_00953 [Colletotrichum orchidophilum]
MVKKKNPPGKKQRDRMKAKKVREETAEMLENQNRPKKQVATDEKGRKMTVIIGGEAEMDELWQRMKTTHSLQCQTSTISKKLDALRTALDDRMNEYDTGHIKDTLKQVEIQVKGLTGRMRDAMNKNNLEAAEQDIHISELIFFDLSLNGPLEIEEVATGFEEQLAEAQRNMDKLELQLASSL